MKFIDSHAHLSSFNNIQDVIKKADNINVRKIVAVSTELQSCIKTLEMARIYPKKIYPTLGIHPSQIDETSPEEVSSLLSKNLRKIVAVGEIGLDYSRTKEKEIQVKQHKTYINLLKLAKTHRKTASVHSRMAYTDAFELAVKYGPKKIVFHWYDGPIEILEKILEEGYFISATPAVETSKNHENVAKVTSKNAEYVFNLNE
jgi:TatD DNase family protein